MSAKRDLIKYLVDYLGDVYYGDEIKEKNQDFFVSPKELERILRKYFLFFENNNELISSVKKNYNYIKDMSFQHKADSYFKLKLVDSKGKSIPTNVRYTTEQHNSQAHIIHSHLIKAFEEKLNRVKDLPSNEDTNPYPLLFISLGIYLKFIEYTSKHIIDVYLDYSYLKKRLEHDHLIHRVKDNEFMRILFDNMKLIKSQDYKKYCIKNKLSSLDKSSSSNRENNFNNIFLD